MITTKLSEYALVQAPWPALYTTMVADPPEPPGFELTATMCPPVHVVFTLTKTKDVVTIRELVKVMVCELPLGTKSLLSEVILPVIVFSVTALLETVPESYSNP